MEEFPSNARSRREAAMQEPSKSRVERVTLSPVSVRKKSRARRFADLFLGNDPRGVGERVVGDVLIPAMRDMVANGFQQFVDGLIYPDGRNRGRGVRPSGMAQAQYHRMSTSRFDQRPDPRAPLSRQARATHNFEELVFDKRVEAEEVLDRLFGLIQEYESATVRDLYDMVNMPAAYTDEKYGWTDIQNADVRPIRGGYLLDLPRPEPLR